MENAEWGLREGGTGGRVRHCGLRLLVVGFGPREIVQRGYALILLWRAVEDGSRGSADGRWEDVDGCRRGVARQCRELVVGAEHGGTRQGRRGGPVVVTLERSSLRWCNPKRGLATVIWERVIAFLLLANQRLVAVWGLLLRHAVSSRGHVVGILGLDVDLCGLAFGLGPATPLRRVAGTDEATPYTIAT